jgi:uncharacterized Zn-binding protein involved in type VI secretion
MAEAIQTLGGAISCGDRHAPPGRRVLVNGEPVVVLGDLSAGHGGFPPTPAIEGNSRVLVNGVPVVCFGHRYADHSDGDTVHTDRRSIQVTKVRAG